MVRHGLLAALSLYLLAELGNMFPRQSATLPVKSLRITTLLPIFKDWVIGLINQPAKKDGQLDKLLLMEANLTSLTSADTDIFSSLLGHRINHLVGMPFVLIKTGSIGASVLPYAIGGCVRRSPMN